MTSKTVFLLTAIINFAVATSSYGRQKVLVLAENGGQHEAFTRTGLQWLKEQSQAMDFDMTTLSDGHQLKAGDIGLYDLIVQLNYPPYAWSEASVSEFEQAIDQGTVSWVGFHHASLLGEFDGYPMWQWFSDFLGGIRFQNYIAEKADGEVTVEDGGHPVMTGVSPQFTIREDEWYTYNRNPRPDVHVLASVNEESYSPASPIRMGDHPVIWTNPRKAARNVYFQIGHSASLFLNSDFVRMFRNALCWGLHRPMPLDQSHALEQALAGKAVSRQESVPLTGWHHSGIGTVSQTDGQLCLALPLNTGQRARGSAGDPDYAIYGSCSAQLQIDDRNLEHYSQLAFDIRTDLEAGVANVNIALLTEPTSQLGAHLVNVQGNTWQHVVYQISELPRSRVRALSIYTDLKGRNLSRHDSIHYYIKDMQWQRTETTEQYRGWQTAAGHIAYSTSGYLTEGAKTAIVAAAGSRPFQLVDVLTGETIFAGHSAKPQSTLDGQFQLLDFSDVHRQGLYRLVSDTLTTAPFPISNQALQGSEWKTLNFIHAQRCGQAVSGIHGPCHRDVYCDHQGQSYSYGGGWHDAGDLSQQTLQTADVTYALLETYEKRKDVLPQLASLLLDEARHGLAQMMRCRLGNGWHASSIGLLHWTDGIEGTADDIHTVRKQNLAFDNFLYAAYEAYAARLLNDEALRRAATEDFDYAARKYEREGIDTFRITMEHSYNTSAVTFMAAASWAASQLYVLTHQRKYARRAARYARLLLDCQEQQGDFAGYFYRDASRRSIIHYIHQSREQLPVLALVSLCRTQPGHRDYALWHRAVSLYGNYLKQTAPYTQPYGMLPSGIYQKAEYADEDGFRRLHLWAPDNARQLYDRQLAEGVQTDRQHYLRRFPVWFSIFNGNEAVILSAGKAAALCGHFLHDRQLMDIGREQLYWTLGKNPFCQSLIYGEGHRYPAQDSFSSGEIMGEIPVGIRSYGNTDEPYWPLTNNACYKEVWLTSAGKWLSLLSEYE